MTLDDYLYNDDFMANRPVLKDNPDDLDVMEWELTDALWHGLQQARTDNEEHPIESIGYMAGSIIRALDSIRKIRRNGKLDYKGRKILLNDSRQKDNPTQDN